MNEPVTHGSFILDCIQGMPRIDAMHVAHHHHHRM